MFGSTWQQAWASLDLLSIIEQWMHLIFKCLRYTHTLAWRSSGWKANRSKRPRLSSCNVPPSSTAEIDQRIDTDTDQYSHVLYCIIMYSQEAAEIKKLHMFVQCQTEEWSDPKHPNCSQNWCNKAPKWQCRWPHPYHSHHSPRILPACSCSALTWTKSTCEREEPLCSSRSRRKDQSR